MRTNWTNRRLESKGKRNSDDSDSDSDGEDYYVLYDSSDPPENRTLLNDIALYMSRLAVSFFNMREVTTYGNVKLLKAQQYHFWDSPIYITFQALQPSADTPTNFQAKLYVYHCNKTPKFEIIFVRRRPHTLCYKRRRPSDIDCDQPPEFNLPENHDLHHPIPFYQKRLSRIIQQYNIVASASESRWRFAFYLSQYALVGYCINLGEYDAKHDIESLKVLDLVKPKPVQEVQIYLITFEAPLLAKTEGKSSETFEAEILMHALFPITTIEARVKSVKTDSSQSTNGSSVICRMASLPSSEYPYQSH